MAEQIEDKDIRCKMCHRNKDVIIKSSWLCTVCEDSLQFKNPPSASDTIIELYTKNRMYRGLVLVRRKFEPFKGMLALAGGFQEMGESLEQTAIREAKEETGLDIVLQRIIGVRSEPNRDSRKQVNAICYHAVAFGEPKAGDDAESIEIISFDEAWQIKMAFDHKKYLELFMVGQTSGNRDDGIWL